MGLNSCTSATTWTRCTKEDYIPNSNRATWTGWYSFHHSGMSSTETTNWSSTHQSVHSKQAITGELSLTLTRTIFCLLRLYPMFYGNIPTRFLSPTEYANNSVCTSFRLTLQETTSILREFCRKNTLISRIWMTRFPCLRSLGESRSRKEFT